ncbi:MAG: HlyD family efflux transporter periplasmic adaptor subunit [Chloroflexi bacterium]|nr:HlyD family efflux transporter periplasmic adaptor subunit [Chloroflexota bacterium]
MNKSSSLILVCCLLFVVLLTGCESDAAADGPIAASGFIEGEQVVVASETSGRIAEMMVDRGDDVLAGDVLVRLDDAMLQSQRLEAEAGMATANANLARVLAGVRPEQVAAAQAVLAQAEAQRDGASQAVINAQDTISNPLALNVEIDVARTQVRLAEQSVEMVETDLAEIELRRSIYHDLSGDAERSWNLQIQAVQATMTQAEAELQGAWRYLNALQTMRENPLSMQAQLHGAETQLLLAGAQVDGAQAALDELEAGSSEEEIAMAEAQVRMAEAAIQLIDAQIAQLTLTAPMDGIVTSRSSQAGETASMGLPLLTIANLDEVTLVIYIPETRVGQIRIGQEVEVQVDSFPDRVFVGEVVNVAGEAEFTPRNVQTKEERVNLVFAVKVHIPNPDGVLKPGMPADATVRE